MITRLAHLDRICAEKDFSTVDDPVKELRKLQNDPSLIQTNSLNKRSCHHQTLQHLFQIITHYINALCSIEPDSVSSPQIRSPLMGRSPIPPIKSPPAMLQIEEHSNTTVATLAPTGPTVCNYLCG